MTARLPLGRRPGSLSGGGLTVPEVVVTLPTGPAGAESGTLQRLAIGAAEVAVDGVPLVTVGPVRVTTSDEGVMTVDVSLAVTGVRVAPPESPR